MTPQVTRPPLITYVYAHEQLSQIVAEIVAKNDSEFVPLSANITEQMACNCPKDGKAVVVIHPKPKEDLAELMSSICCQVPANSHILVISEDRDHHHLISTFDCANSKALPSHLSTKEIEVEILKALRACGEHEEAEKSQIAEAEHIRECCERLTASELDVLCMVLDGSLNKAIANRLDVSERTVENRRRKIFETFGTHSIAVITRKISETIGCDAVYSMRDARHQQGS